MKRYGNLYPKICDFSNIWRGHMNARVGKRHYKEVKQIDADPVKYIKKLRSILEYKTFENSKYRKMIKQCSGKTREILKLPYFPDRIIHHCIVQVCEPIWNKMFIRDTFACLKGRGIHDGVDRIKAAFRDIEGTKHCLKMDVQKFYPSMDHSVLKELIARKIKCTDTLELLWKIIDSVEGGVPIGNYLSQYFGNIYLTGYDHFMKENQECKYYYRYCDDIVVLAESKHRLHELRKETERYWENKLKLTLKPNWQVFPVDSRGLDFLGYRFFHGYTLLRKSTSLKFKRKMKLISKNWKSMRPVSVVSSVMSYEGWLRHGNCLNLKRRYFNDDIKQIVAGMCKRNPLKDCMV